MEVTTQVNSDTKIPFLSRQEAVALTLSVQSQIKAMSIWVYLMGSSWQLIPKGFSIVFFCCCCCILVCAGVEFNLGAELPFNSQWISVFFAVTVVLKTPRGTILSSIVMACSSTNGNSIQSIICIPCHFITFRISVIANIE